jgi:hypothetical protein
VRFPDGLFADRGRLVAWGVLGALLLANLVGAVTFDRQDWPALVGDEATYAMQAASLAYDFDLAYERVDYDRFVEHWGRLPEGLILQSRDGGERITYGKPSVYAAVIAPFVRVAPVRGGPVANALLLALAALLAASTLESRVGRWAPLWVAVFVFASVTFAYTFWVHADLFLLAATVSAFALLYRRDRPQRERFDEVYQGGAEEAVGWKVALRWAAAGALLGAVGAFRPFYLALLLPAIVIASGRHERERWAKLGSLGLGVLLALGLTAASSVWAGGSWSGYAGERQGFYERTGYPDVDFPASDWGESVRRWGNTSWIHEETLDFELDARLWAYDALYFVAGENVGVVAYFLPLLLAFGACRKERGRWAILVAAAVVVACFFLVRPFNFYGGGGAIGNRYFLPVYGALWFVAARRVHPGWVLAAALAAAPYLYPLWLAPRNFPQQMDAQGVTRYAHVSPVARRLLPYETTQSHIPGGRDVVHNGLWIKFLSSDLGPVGPQGEGETLSMTTHGQGELLVGSGVPLGELILRLGAGSPSRIEVAGAEILQTGFDPEGGANFLLDIDEPTYRHPMWWTWDDVYLYRLSFAFPESGEERPVTLTLRPRDPGASP